MRYSSLLLLGLVLVLSLLFTGISSESHPSPDQEHEYLDDEPEEPVRSTAKASRPKYSKPPMDPYSAQRKEEIRKEAERRNNPAYVLSSDKREVETEYRKPTLSDALIPFSKFLTSYILPPRWSTWVVLPGTGYLALVGLTTPEKTWKRLYSQYKHWLPWLQLPLLAILLLLIYYSYVVFIYTVRDVILGLLQALFLRVVVFAPKEPHVRRKHEPLPPVVHPPIRSAWTIASSLVILTIMIVLTEWAN